MITAFEQKQMQRNVQIKLLRGLLDLIMLQLIHTQAMHGYQLITSIRKTFGTYFGPSTIYPLLGLLEEKGYIKSTWDLNNDRPRKVYTLTHLGEELLRYSEDSLELVLRKMASIENVTLQVERLCDLV